MQLSELRLRSAHPKDCPHLLLWDNPDPEALRQLAWRENAKLVSYREDLLQRIDPKSRFLALHHQCDRELEAIRSLCSQTTEPVVILQDLDCLIAYLSVQADSPITLFWQNLFNTRHLERILWILLPSQVAPPDWQQNRLQRL
jgi:hypothetical protein